MTGEDIPELSVVVPVFNERDNVAPLVHEIVVALRGRIPFEIVYVDDCSKDDSFAVLTGLMASTPELRVLRHTAQSGQSTAIRNGVKAARGAWIATLDGDGQNDPADIPKLLAARDQADRSLKLFAGWRVNRHDSGSKRWASKIANAIRSRLLRDETPDTGCGIKLFERAVFLDLPYFDHMHRYLPALVKRAGWRIGQRAGQPPRALDRGVQVQQPQSRLGRACRPARRRLADQAQQDHRRPAKSSENERADRLAERLRRPHDAVEADRPDRGPDVRRALAGAVRRLQAPRQAGHPAGVLVHEHRRQPDDAELFRVLGQAGRGRRAAEPVSRLHRRSTACTWTSSTAAGIGIGLGTEGSGGCASRG